MSLVVSVMFVLFLFGFIAFSKGLDFDALAGRKDPDTCCDKLDNNTFSTNCQQTLLQAGKLEKFAYSPGFPNEFSPNKLCSWGIYARAGKRVRLEFRDFYLIGPADDGACLSQGVIIKSPLSGLQIGPHCGNAGLPSIISAGNYLVVELISNIPMTSEGFRGFRMSYVESIETPSHALRPANWASDVILTVDPMTIEKLFPVATPAATRKSPKPTRRSSRFSPSRRPILPARPFAPPRGYPNRIGNERPPPTEEYPPHEPSPVLSTEIIVGIAVGCVIVLAVLILILVTCMQARKLKKENQKRQKSEEMRMENQQTPADEYGNGYPYTGPNGFPQEPPPGYYFAYHDEADNVAKHHAKEQPKSSVKKEPNSQHNGNSKSGKSHSRKKQRRVRNLRTISISARSRMIGKERKDKKGDQGKDERDSENPRVKEKAHAPESRHRAKPSREKDSPSRRRQSKSRDEVTRKEKQTEKSSKHGRESSKSGEMCNTLKHGRPSSRDHCKDDTLKVRKSQSKQRRRTYNHKKHAGENNNGKKRTSTSKSRRKTSREE